MKISEHSISAVGSIITGDKKMSPYRTGSDLVNFFNQFGSEDTFCPGQEELADCLRQILSGLTSIVSGLASMRNIMSDSHSIRYKPAEHHARLAVNTSKTLSHFLFDTNKYQKK